MEMFVLVTVALIIMAGVGYHLGYQQGYIDGRTSRTRPRTRR